jgi:hypothetical protein
MLKQDLRFQLIFLKEEQAVYKVGGKSVPSSRISERERELAKL